MKYGLSLIITSAIIVAGVIGSLVVSTFVSAAPDSGIRLETSATLVDTDWLGSLNEYRRMSGLAPVTHNAEWDQGTKRHSCYMLNNGLAHDEIEGREGYTPDGDVAGNAGNVAGTGSTSTPAKMFVELWLTGPFHAIGMLRPNLKSTSYGECRREETPTVWKSAATLDVIRGADWSAPRSTEPTLFPGRGSTIPLYRLITETPNPVKLCGWNTTSKAGLPLIAMMPNAVTRASSSLSGPSGPVQTCTLHGKNTDGTAASVLNGDNAVVIVPNSPLKDGTYTATVQSDGGDVTWSFNIDRDAQLSASAAPPLNSPPETPPPADAPERSPKILGNSSRLQSTTPYRHVDTRIGQGATRLQAGTMQRIQLADPGVAAVSANVTAVGANGLGFLTIYSCRGEVPTVSTLNYGPGEVKANHATIPISDGYACFYSHDDVDVLVDINGHYIETAENEYPKRSGFVAATPTRLIDTRNEPVPLHAGTIRRIDLAPTTAPNSATAVSLNVTAVNPVNNGFISVFPCGHQTDISSVNYTAGSVQPNSAVVPLDSQGDVCVMSLVDTHLLIDYNGYFAADAKSGLVPIQPVRILDTRETGVLNDHTGGARTAKGTILRIPLTGPNNPLPDGLVIPSQANAVSINITAVDPETATYVTAYPCDQSRPNSSNVNLPANQVASANGALTMLSAQGELCVYTLNPTHLVVDINGFWLTN